MIEGIERKYNSLRGVPRPEWVKQKIAKTQTGKRYGPETGKKISLAKKGKPNLKIKGENNGIWVGNNISYFGLHGWVRRNKPKSTFCESCGKQTKLDIANISGEYKRDIDDFKWLCRRCHMLEDG